MFLLLPEFSQTFGFWAYTELMRYPTKGKQPNKRRCCCQCCSYSIRIWFIVRFISLWLRLHFAFVRSIIRLINRSIFITSLLSSQAWLRLSITVHLLYIGLPESKVHLPHDFIIYRVLILLPLEVAIDMLIKTTPTAITWEQSFSWNTVSCINCLIVLYYIVSYWFETNFKIKPFQPNVWMQTQCD